MKNCKFLHDLKYKWLECVNFALKIHCMSEKTKKDRNEKDCKEHRRALFAFKRR